MKSRFDGLQLEIVMSLFVVMLAGLAIGIRTDGSLFADAFVDNVLLGPVSEGAEVICPDGHDPKGGADLYGAGVSEGITEWGNVDGINAYSCRYYSGILSPGA